MDSKKYFITSDVHSFATELKDVLKKAGFKKSNKDNVLVVAGDIFDRGSEALAVYEYLRSIPKSRRILIKGNHEQLYLDLLEKQFPESHDFSNGTVSTFCQIAGIDEKLFDFKYQVKEVYRKGLEPNKNHIRDRMDAIWDNVRYQVENHPITKWLQSDEWINYFEIDNFIITHSFIPTRVKIDTSEMFKYYPTYLLPESNLEPIPEWRSLNHDCLEWEEARWGCPWKQFTAGLFDKERENGKTLICGHWFACDFHKVFENIKSCDNTPYIGDNLVALDSCVVKSGFCNVLVISQGKILDNQL